MGAPPEAGPCVCCWALASGLVSAWLASPQSSRKRRSASLDVNVDVDVDRDTS